MVPLVKVENLVKYFPVYSKQIFRKKIIANVHAVDDISFTVNEGETVGLVGESGCGKTTTGKLILNLENLTSGTIHYNEKDVLDTFKTASTEDKMSLRRSMQRRIPAVL